MPGFVREMGMDESDEDMLNQVMGMPSHPEVCKAIRDAVRQKSPADPFLGPRPSGPAAGSGAGGGG